MAEILNCPACNTEMKDVVISEANIKIDICMDGCGGMFFDNRELQKVDEQHESIDSILALLDGKVFKSVNESSIRECPLCGTNMVKKFTSIKQEVEIDECYSCGGKFLDNGELVKLRQEYVNDEERSLAIQEVAKTIFSSQLQEYKSQASPLKRLFDKMMGL